MSIQQYFFSVCLYMALLRTVQARRLLNRIDFEDAIQRRIHAHISTYVKIKQGRYLGKLYYGQNDHWYQSYADIPYAQPPIGKLQFKKPEPPKPHDDLLFDATKSIDYQELVVRCKQLVRGDHIKEGNKNESDYNIRNSIFNDTILGHETCLYMDIIKPVPLDLQQKDRKDHDIIGLLPKAPVLVLLHPSSFMVDIPVNHYLWAEYFCCNYVVFAIVRFRLGPYGFPNMGSRASVGLPPDEKVMVPNLGLWDQHAALSWIQQNIYAWGGDPSKVTLAGVAGGGAFVNYHLMASASRGLFHKAISIGGSALCPWAFAKDSIRKTVASILEVPCVSDNKEICPQPFIRDVLAGKGSYYYEYQNMPMNPFGPVVDDDFIFAAPEIMMRVNHTHPVPWLVGFSTDYSVYPNFNFLSKTWKPPQKTIATWDDVAPLFLGLKGRIDSEIQTDVALGIIQRYLKGGEQFALFPLNSKTPVKDTADFFAIFDKPFNETFKLRNNLTKMISDCMYTTGIVEAARLHAWSLRSRVDDNPGNPDDELIKPKVYLHQFNFSLSPLTDFLTINQNDWEIKHSKEFSKYKPTILDEGADNIFYKQSPEEILRRKLVSAWASLMRDGEVFEIRRNQFGENSTFKWGSLTEYASSFSSRTIKFGISFLSKYFWPPVNRVKKWHVHYTLLNGTDDKIESTLELSDNVGDSNYWRQVPFQIYEDFNDHEVIYDDIKEFGIDNA